MEVLRSLRVVAQLQQRRWAAAVSQYFGNIFPFSEQQRWSGMPALAGTGGYGISPDECGYDPLSDNGLVLMAVPKRKTTRSKKRMRHTHKWLQNLEHIGTCGTCGNAMLFQRVCGHCLKVALKDTKTIRKREMGIEVKEKEDAAAQQ